MEISNRANLIFNNNGSIVIRHAFQSRDGKFHDIVVTDGDRRFRKEEWTGCEKILLQKIWTVYSECIQQIQKHDDLKKYAREHVRFVYNKNPSKSNPDKTKLFINSSKQYDIGHLPKINEELDTLSTILLKPHAKVLPPKPEPVVKPTTTKVLKPKKNAPDTAAEPAKPIVAGNAEVSPKPAVKLPPVIKPAHADPALVNAPPHPLPKLPLIQRPVKPEVDHLVENRNKGYKKLINRGKELLGRAFNSNALKQQLLQPN